MIDYTPIEEKIAKIKADTEKFMNELYSKRE